MEIGLVFLGILLFLTSVFMMLLILVQRGKGGGLTGALGGMGGQSAFGSKAGDVFTKITVITAIIWITLCMLTIAIYNPPPVNDLDSRKAGESSISNVEDGEDESSESDEATGEVGIDSTEEIPDDLEEQVSEIIADSDDESSDTDSSDDDSGPALEEPANDSSEDSGSGEEDSSSEPESSDDN